MFPQWTTNLHRLTCCFILGTSIVALANIWFSLYDNNRMNAGVKVLGDLMHTYSCAHTQSNKPQCHCLIYTCKSSNIFSAHQDTKGNTKQYKTFFLSFSPVKHLWQDDQYNLYNEAGNIKYSGPWLFRSVDLLESELEKEATEGRAKRVRVMLWGAAAPLLCIWRFAQGSLLLWISLLFCLPSVSHSIRRSTK